MNEFVRTLIEDVLGRLKDKLTPAQILAMLPDILRIMQDVTDGGDTLTAETRGIVLMRVDELIHGKEV